MAYAKSDLTKLHRSQKRGSYDKQLVHEILDRGVVAHVAYVDGEGNVKVSPMIYGRQEDALYLHGHVSAGVLRNGSIDLCFCMTLEDGLVLARSGMHSSVNYRCVMVHGKAEEVADPTAKWSSLDLIVDHAAGSPGFSQTVQRPMTEAEVASTRVLRLEMKDGCVSAKTRAEGANDDKEDIENPKLWAGIVPITRVYGPAVNDPSLRFHVLPPEAVRNYPKHRSGLPHCVEKRSGDHRPYIALALTFGAGLLVGAWMSKR